MRRQRRGIQLLALIMGLSLIAVACGGDDDDNEGQAQQEEVPQGGTLVIGAEQEPECIDWISSCSGSSWGYWMMNVNTMPRTFDIVKNGDTWKYEASILLDGDPDVEADPQKITYHIADEAVWSDGEPITCDDFHYTWDQIVTGEDIYDTTGYANIESVDCPDDKTAVATFSEPYAAWKQLFGGQFGVFPSHILEGQDRDAMMANGYDFSGGPWKIERWDKGVEVRLVPNDQYWGDKPKLDGVTFRFVTDTSAEFQAFKAGEVSSIYPQPQLDAIEEINRGLSGAQSSVNQQTPNSEGLWMNNAAFPFDSVAVRQAFAYSIDRAAIVERLFGDIGIDAPMNTFNAPVLGDFGDPDAFADYELDLDKVDELMTDDGWEKNGDGIWEKGGRPANIVMKTTTGNARRELTEQIVQQQAQEAGFHVTVQNREAGDLFGTDLPQGDYVLALYAQVLTALDPSLCNLFCSQNVPTQQNQFSGQNWTRTNIDGLDEPLTTVDQSLDADERQDAGAEADQLLAENVASLPLDPLPNILLWTDDVLGPVGDNPILGPFWNINEWGVAQ